MRDTHRSLRRALAAWALQPVVIVAELVVAAASTAPYSFAHNTISDLGAMPLLAVVAVRLTRHHSARVNPTPRAI